jgi:hypothetical protein
VILYPDGISGPPKKKGKGSKGSKGIPGKTPGPWRSGYVLPGDGKKGGKKGGAGKVLLGTSTALVPTSSRALATSEGPPSMWPWILGGLVVLAGAFWYTRKGKGRRRPLGFA